MHHTTVVQCTTLQYYSVLEKSGMLRIVQFTLYRVHSTAIELAVAYYASIEHSAEKRYITVYASIRCSTGIFYTLAISNSTVMHYTVIYSTKIFNFIFIHCRAAIHYSTYIYFTTAIHYSAAIHCSTEIVYTSAICYSAEIFYTTSLPYN